MIVSGLVNVQDHRQDALSIYVSIKWNLFYRQNYSYFRPKMLKITRDMYRNTILEIGNCCVTLVSGTFQQDSVPAHQVKLAQAWCRENFLYFITTEEWKPNSPNLNPMDYSIWSILEAPACANHHRSLELLKFVRIRVFQWNLEETCKGCIYQTYVEKRKKRDVFNKDILITSGPSTTWYPTRI